MSDTRETAGDRAARHYATLLAPIYGWMIGDVRSAIERSRVELQELGVAAAQEGARALDLGAGTGLQTIPLIELGYEVTAVDGSERLLAELSTASPRTRIVRADLLAFDRFLAGTCDVIVCMGDTLTHLRCLDDVHLLLETVAAHLAPGGLLALTFRDYSGPPPDPADRLILVRAAGGRILTCLLEYDGDRVRVTDIVHELSAGQWSLRSSRYEKLRLSPSAIASALADAGLRVDRCNVIGGRVSIVARRGVCG